MENFDSTSTGLNLGRAPASLLIRFGKREISVCRDFRKRFYAINPILDCCAGIERGHVELILLSRWLITFSKAAEPTTKFSSAMNGYC